MFSSIAENTLHVFGAINFLTIPMIWAFYPETANRTLEEMDHLFMSESPFVWEEEAYFRKWKEEGEPSVANKGAIKQQPEEIDIKVDESRKEKEAS